MNSKSETATGFRSAIDRIRSIDAASVVSERVQHRHTIKDVKKGGAIRLDGRTYVVSGVSTYVETNEDFSKQKKWKWYELRLVDLLTGEVVWIEWEVDDELVIYRTVKKISFDDLCDEEEEDIDETDLRQITVDQDSVYYLGREFEFEERCAAKYLRDGEGRESKGDKVYLYDFTAGGEAITIEAWKDGGSFSYELYLSTKLSDGAVTIIALGTEG